MTDPIAYHPSASQMQNALTALPTVGVGNLIVSKRASVPEYEVWFGGALASQNLPQIVADYSGLNRGSVDVSTITEGAGGAKKEKKPTKRSPQRSRRS